MSILFDEILEVEDLNTCGKKFERVNRLHCLGAARGSDIKVILDINCELFEVSAGDRIQLALASSISADGRPDDGLYDSTAEYKLLDSFDYAMHGRLFSLKHTANQHMEIQVSFGGLLLRLDGPQTIMEPFAMDMMLFVLIKNRSNEGTVQMAV